MASALTFGEDRYLRPGTRIRRDFFLNQDEHPTSEYGGIVHCWFDEGIKMFDCYIAFFGDGFPDGQPTEKPYVLRYAAVGLVEISD